MSESNPIFNEANFPVQSALWFNNTLNEYLSYAPKQDNVFALANLMLCLEYKAVAVYCNDTYLLPPLPPFYYSIGALGSTVQSPSNAVETIRRIVTYFVECDVIPDNDRGYWHTRLMRLLKSFVDDHIPKN